MNITMQVLFSESWKPLAEVTIQNMMDYCKGRYSYSPNMIPDPFEHFDKINTIYDTFNLYDDADIIFSRDLDVLITNFNVRIEDFLEGSKDFYITKDFNGINAGVFIIRKSSWSQKFLWYLMSQKGKEGMHCEQNAIEAYMKESPNDEKIKVLPHPSINSYLNENYPECGVQTHETGQWHEGDFMLHLPALPIEKRISIFKNTKITL